MDVMVDIETLGTTPGCVVLSVGACTFHLSSGEIHQEFEHTIAIEPQTDKGMHIEGGTLSWWMKQPEVAREHSFSEGYYPQITAYAFVDWFQSVGGINLWAQGMDFDPPILGKFLQTFGANPPWKFWNVRDTRTVYDLARYRTGFNVKQDVPRDGVHHTALDDCRHQVKALHEAFARL